MPPSRPSMSPKPTRSSRCALSSLARASRAHTLTRQKSIRTARAQPHQGARDDRQKEEAGGDTEDAQVDVEGVVVGRVQARRARGAAQGRARRARPLQDAAHHPVALRVRDGRVCRRERQGARDVQGGAPCSVPARARLRGHHHLHARALYTPRLPRLRGRCPLRAASRRRRVALVAGARDPLVGGARHGAALGHHVPLALLHARHPPGRGLPVHQLYRNLQPVRVPLAHTTPLYHDRSSAHTTHRTPHSTL